MRDADDLEELDAYPEHDEPVVRCPECGDDDRHEPDCSRNYLTQKEAKRIEDANTERPWPFNSERLTITLGVCGDSQEGSFMNATLQSTNNDPNLEFSVAVHVDVPDEVKTQEQLADYLGGMFGDLLDQPTGQGVRVEVYLGPPGDGEEG